ncbi:hypothetical protein FOA43_001525 [Brettanomyces nanus]|uniref:Leucine-rich repeat-containing protein n=1 Tax=Eeniella nana TaxID=13502 RepID=A0A875RXK1_EENNA|nr:uncharacterized protein FOA43_001525 [Brettanomyces nanus]QPG74201.1 hypothetical protein FOA43_001525 [Brettanomyces nanus]
MGTANTCDGDAYAHNLAAFIRAHERQLANALLAYKKSSRTTSNKRKQNLTRGNNSSASVTATAPTALQITKPVRLSMSLHHLYFLLGKFQDLGIDVGPMTIRLDNIDAETSGNYVSFLSEFQRKKLISSDTQSIHSMSSVKSVMSSVSALWNSLGNSSGKYNNISSDLEYLYSAFTKLPCLRLANDPKAKMIEGHEEYPFETATPINIFRNLVVLEICEIDPKEVYGWDFLSENIRYLVVKKAGITNPQDILIDLVNEDAEKRSGSVRSADSAIVDDMPPPESISIIRQSYPSPIIQPSGCAAATAIKISMSPPPPSSSSSSVSLRYQPLTPLQSSTQPVATSSTLSSSTPSSYYSGVNRIHSSIEDPNRRQYYYYQKLSRNRRPHRSNSVISEGRRSLISDFSDDRTTTAALSPERFSEKGTTTKLHSVNNWKLLKHLSFTENCISKITSASFSHISNLSSLDLSYNRLTSVPSEALSKLPNLKSLNLSFNRLISAHDFPSNMNKLVILNLRGNRLVDLESIDRLKSLEKLDIRQNRLKKIAGLKPLLMTGSNKVILKAVYLAGNPLSSNRGYRMELFNLFNGINYSNNVKIDGSRPGIFESRLLLDPKSSKIKLHKFLDASIISKMTASVSSMNLRKVIMMTTTTTTGRRGMTSRTQPEADKMNDKLEEKPVSKFESLKAPSKIRTTTMTATPTKGDTKKRPESSVNVPLNTSTTIDTSSPLTEPHSVLAPNRNVINTKIPLAQLQKPFGSNIRPPTNRTSTLTSLLDHMSDKETLKSEESTTRGDASTISSRRASQDSNPINRISIASPALPVITQTTTMTTSVTSNPIATPTKPKHENPPQTDDSLKIEPAILYLIDNSPPAFS